MTAHRLLLTALLCFALAPLVPARPSADERAERLDAFVQRCEVLGFSGAVIVEEDGQVLVDRAAGLANRESGAGNTTETLFDVGQFTMQFTAAAVLLLEDREALTLDDPLERWLDGVPEDKRGITIRQLLAHSSGLPGFIEATDAGAPDRAGMLERVLAAPLSAEPGTQFDRGRPGYLVLGAVIEIVSGETYEAFLIENLFRPAGMKTSGFRGQAGIDAGRVAVGYADGLVQSVPAKEPLTWNERGSSGALCTAQDLLRWELALRAETVLSANATRQLLTPIHRHIALGGWQVVQEFDGRLRHEHGAFGGGFQSRILRHPNHDAVVIWLANDNVASILMPAELGRALRGEKHREPPPVVRLSPDELDRFAGEYAGETSTHVRLVPAGDHLDLVPLDQGTATTLHAPVLFQQPVTDPLGESRRAVRVLESLRSKDTAALERLLNPGLPGGSQGLLKRWQETLAERGGLDAHQVVATLGDRSGPQSWVRLDTGQGTGSEYVRLDWRNERLVGLHFGQAFPAILEATPLGPDELTLFNLTAMTNRGGIRMSDSNDQRLLTLRIDGGEARLYRVGD